MDKNNLIVVCYISINEMGPIQSNYIKKQKIKYLRKYLQWLGLTQKDVYIDEDFIESATKKPQLQEIISMVEKNEVNLFVTNSIYELGNSFMDSIKFIEYLAEKNIRVICIDNNIDTASLLG